MIAATLPCSGMMLLVAYYGRKTGTYMRRSNSLKISAKKKPFPPGSVCKPCWELKYCPYGPLVEIFPIYDSDCDLDERKALYRETLNEVMGPLKSEEEAWSAIMRLMYLNPDNWEYIVNFDPVTVRCNEWGHICPVFCTQSGATETVSGRTEGRYIPRSVMLKVIRRDNYHCQLCNAHVNDKDIELDHIIPISRGGPTTVENLRLLCTTCNQKRSNSTNDILKSK